MRCTGTGSLDDAFRFSCFVSSFHAWTYGLVIFSTALTLLRCVRNRERDVVGGACALGRLLQLGSVSFHSSRRHALICLLPFRHQRRCKRPTRQGLRLHH